MSPAADGHDLKGYFTELSNWNRWGADDQLGTLNYIQAPQRLAAAGLMQQGVVIGCQRPIAAAAVPAAPSQAFRLMVTTGESEPKIGGGFASEWLALRFHGMTVTHLDSLGHAFSDGHVYGGRDSDAVGLSDGATFGSIDALRGAGIVCRGVLLDVPRSLGRSFLDPGERIGADQLAQCAATQGIVVESGDALIVRTGRDEAAHHHPGVTDLAGLEPHCLPWLHAQQVSILGSDGISDAAPSGYEAYMFPVHEIGITAMGLWLLDNMALEDLAAECARRQQWEFCFVLAPLNVAGATGSPLNPLAIF